jgi:hypothetical protein
MTSTPSLLKESSPLASMTTRWRPFARSWPSHPSSTGAV